MPKADFIEQLRRRLVDLGCPIAHMRRLAQEVADHREDLKQAALSEGLSESTAETRADAQLGNPLELAERLAMTLRQSSWWGRHSIIGFCLVPLLAFPVLWALLVVLGLVPVWLTMSYGLSPDQLRIANDDPDTFHHILIVVNCVQHIAVALVALLFCWLARRSALSLKWTAIACSICSLYALFIRLTLNPHSLILGLGVPWTPQWIRFAIPLLIVATVCTLRWRAARCFGENVAV